MTPRENRELKDYNDWHKKTVNELKTGDIFTSKHDEILIVNRDKRRKKVFFHHSVFNFEKIELNSFLFDESFNKIGELSRFKMFLLKLGMLKIKL